MSITEQTTVTEIAGAHPASVRVFQRHGIDFCCGGKRPIGAVCREHGLSFAEIASEIQAASEQAHDGGRDWSAAPLAALTRHVVDAYHDPLREELPRLEAMSARVAHVHGERAPYLARIEAVVRELSADLHSHMRKEEMVLFPAIEGIEAHGAAPMPISAPISVMEHEHDHAGELLAELRRITSGYQAPEWGCGTVRALYSGLADLESAMHVHVHLENNILFPRALALAAAT